MWLYTSSPAARRKLDVCAKKIRYGWWRRLFQVIIFVAINGKEKGVRMKNEDHL